MHDGWTEYARLFNALSSSRPSFHLPHSFPLSHKAELKVYLNWDETSILAFGFLNAFETRGNIFRSSSPASDRELHGAFSAPKHGSGDR